MNANEDTLQPVKYLGKVRSLYAHGIGVAIEPVRLIWIRSKKGTRYNRCGISIHSFGLSIYEEIYNGTYKNVWSDAIADISYCVAEPLHPRLFAWISRAKVSNELECHVILCKTSKRARLLADLLAKAFQDSFQYRQQQRAIDSSSISGRCSVCDTIARNQQKDHRMRTLACRSHSHDHHHRQGLHDDYERMSIQTPRTNFERNSIYNNSRRSFDNDTTLADEESIKPVEYYRG